jgi:hypothetical protein
MRIILAITLFVVSALLIAYITVAIVTLVTAEGLSAVPHEVFYVWPNNMIFAVCLGLGIAFFCAAVCVLCSRREPTRRA